MQLSMPLHLAVPVPVPPHLSAPSSRLIPAISGACPWPRSPLIPPRTKGRRKWPTQCVKLKRYDCACKEHRSESSSMEPRPKELSSRKRKRSPRSKLVQALQTPRKLYQSHRLFGRKRREKTARSKPKRMNPPRLLCKCCNTSGIWLER